MRVARNESVYVQRYNMKASTVTISAIAALNFPIPSSFLQVSK